MSREDRVQPVWDAVAYGHALQENVGFDLERSRKLRQEKDQRAERWLQWVQGLGLVLATLLISFSATVLIF